jgi:hypothetical protein
MTFDNNFWNQRYSQTPFPYSDKPNLFVENFFKNHVAPKNSKILVPADGDGRNGLWLAKQGYQVQAFDYSETAVELANSQAQKLGLNYVSRVQDIKNWNPPQNEFDFVVVVFFHLEPELFQMSLQKYSKALKNKNAFLVAQFFHKNQLGKNSGGPKDLDMLCNKESFLCLENSFNKTQTESTEPILDEGPLHQGQASLINLIAQR